MFLATLFASSGLIPRKSQRSLSLNAGRWCFFASAVSLFMFLLTEVAVSLFKYSKENEAWLTHFSPMSHFYAPWKLLKDTLLHLLGNFLEIQDNICCMTRASFQTLTLVWTLSRLVSSSTYDGLFNKENFDCSVSISIGSNNDRGCFGWDYLNTFVRSLSCSSCMSVKRW